MRDAHFDLKIPPEVFDEVAAELANALDDFKVPEREKQEVLAGFAGEKGEVTAGSSRGRSTGAAGVEPGVTRTANSIPGRRARRGGGDRPRPAMRPSWPA